jgi:hypothetical protein
MVNTLFRAGINKKALTDFYVFDIETGKYNKRTGVIKWVTEAKPENFIFGVIYGLNYHKVCYSPQEMIQTFMEPRFKNKKVFAHNAQYDLNGIYGNIYDFDPKAVFNGRFIFAPNGNGEKFKFADSFNILSTSVANIGKMIGKHKEGMTGKGEYDDTNWHDEKERAAAINGCTRDCEIVWEALYSYFEFADEIKLTQAGLSMHYFCRHHLKHNIEHNKHQKHFLNSYYGGRTEAFYKNVIEGGARMIDANSMYPYWMKNAVFPNPKTIKVEHNIKVKKLPQYFKWYEGCVYAKVRHKKTTFGFLPVKIKGKLLFPVGTFTGCWNFNEIKFAIDKGVVEVLHVSKIVYGERMATPFKEFVEVLNEMKINAEKNGDDFGRQMAKDFMNKLYGKFAENITEEGIYIRDISQQWHVIQDYQRKGQFIRLQLFNKNRNDAFLFVKNKKDKKSNHSIPSFASYITSHARVFLLEKMLELENRKILYCDTDSIVLKNSDGIINENFLGGWKVENKIITEIKGLKNYKFIDPKTNTEIWKVKGVPINKGRMIKFVDNNFNETFVPAVKQISDNEFEYTKLIKSREALIKEIEPGGMVIVKKKINNTYDKRLVFADGETQPIEIDEHLKPI